MSEAVLRLGLVGSPNSGKTTLFNALTGLRAKVGNYPGVTVERREGEAKLEGRRVVMVDLPGTYSLTPVSKDEAVVTRLLAGELAGVPQPHALVAVADACSIERSLLLVAQVLALGLPCCLVLTMIDELAARGGVLDLRRLERALGVPVVGVIGHRGVGIDQLRHVLSRAESWGRPPIPPPAAAEERAAWAESVLSHVLHTRPGRNRVTEAIDRVILHPVAGTLIFAVVMLTFFQLIFAWAQPAMNGLDHAVGFARGWLHGVMPAGVAVDFLVDGVLGGVGSVIVFLPQIVLLFGLLYVLDDLGY
ncbi:MAG TPA: FeoB small GTPase domain-containing protein, partial [Myxococcota bacterium]|nr:FeoB small GTPase domain-containing protein [Myxococcota bacterium]